MQYPEQLCVLKINCIVNKIQQEKLNLMKKQEHKSRESAKMPQNKIIVNGPLILFQSKKKPIPTTPHRHRKQPKYSLSKMSKKSMFTCKLFSVTLFHQTILMGTPDLHLSARQPIGFFAFRAFDPIGTSLSSSIPRRYFLGQEKEGKKPGHS